MFPVPHSAGLLCRIAPSTRSPLMLLGLLIVDQQFSFFAETSWLIAGDFDGGEVGVAFAKDAIHFFEGAVGGFWVEEVDDGEDEGVAVGH